MKGKKIKKKKTKTKTKKNHFDQMSEGSQVSKVTLCVEILKWQSPTTTKTKVRYRAARAAKNYLLL